MQHGPLLEQQCKHTAEPGGSEAWQLVGIEGMYQMRRCTYTLACGDSSTVWRPTDAKRCRTGLVLLTSTDSSPWHLPVNSCNAHSGRHLFQSCAFQLLSRFGAPICVLTCCRVGERQGAGAARCAGAARHAARPPRSGALSRPITDFSLTTSGAACAGIHWLIQ